MFGAIMIFPRKKLILPCHKNGYLQSAFDARKYRDRFKRNPLAKVADMFIPKPLRMSPGYPCCCGGDNCEYQDADIYQNDFSSSLEGWASYYTGGYYPWSIIDGYLVYNYATVSYLMRTACQPSPSSELLISVECDCYNINGGSAKYSEAGPAIHIGDGLIPDLYKYSIFIRSYLGSSYLIGWGSTSRATVSQTPYNGDRLEIQIVGTDEDGKYDYIYMVNSIEVYRKSNMSIGFTRNSRILHGLMGELWFGRTADYTYDNYSYASTY